MAVFHSHADSARTGHGTSRSNADLLVGAVFVLVPAAGTLVLIAGWSALQPTGTDVAVSVALYCIAGLGITVGYHRLAAHRSFSSPPFVRAALLVAGSLAFQGPVTRWVADHRRHHAFTDMDGDPHSPLRAPARVPGLVWAHLGWLFAPTRTSVSRYAPDLLRDPISLGISRHYIAFSVASLLIPTMVCGLARSEWEGWTTGLLLGGCARVFAFQHATWAVNSLCHWVGGRSHETRDASTNNVVVAFLTFGEGWHNNHHSRPTSPLHGPTMWLDPSYACICVLAMVGLAHNLRGRR